MYSLSEYSIISLSVIIRYEGEKKYMIKLEYTERDCRQYRIPDVSLLNDDNVSAQNDMECIRGILFQIVDSVVFGNYYTVEDIIHELGGVNYFFELEKEIEIDNEVDLDYIWTEKYEQSFLEMLGSEGKLEPAYFTDTLSEKELEELDNEEESSSKIKENCKKKIYGTIGYNGVTPALSLSEAVYNKVFSRFNSLFFNQLKQVFYDPYSYYDFNNEEDLPENISKEDVHPVIKKFDSEELKIRDEDFSDLFAEWDVKVQYDEKNQTLVGKDIPEESIVTCDLRGFVGYKEAGSYIDVAEKIKSLIEDDEIYGEEYKDRLFGKIVDENSKLIRVGEEKSGRNSAKVLNTYETVIAMVKLLSKNVFIFRYIDNYEEVGSIPEKKISVADIVNSSFYDKLITNMIIRTANNVFESIRYGLNEKANAEDEDVQYLLKLVDVLQYRYLPAASLLLDQNMEEMSDISRREQIFQVIREVAFGKKDYHNRYIEKIKNIFDDLYYKSSNLYSPYLEGDLKVASTRTSYFSKYIENRYQWINYWSKETVIDSELRRKNHNMVQNIYRYGNIISSVEKIISYYDKEIKKDSYMISELKIIDCKLLSEFLDEVQKNFDAIDNKTTIVKPDDNLLFYLLEVAMVPGWSDTIYDVYNEYLRLLSMNDEIEEKREREIRELFKCYAYVVMCLYKLYRIENLEIHQGQNAMFEELGGKREYEEYYAKLRDDYKECVKYLSELMDSEHENLLKRSKMIDRGFSGAPRGDTPLIKYRNITQFDLNDFDVLTEMYQIFRELRDGLKEDIKEILL